MRVILIILRILFGVVFIFSGFVKAVDPLGFSYKLQEYLHVANIISLDSITLPAAIFFSALEFIIGFVLVLGQRLKSVSFMAFGFMAFFTILTFLLAVFNPIKDCGCFGDAIKLSNWETFWKNVVLFAIIILLYIKRDEVKSPFRYPALPASLAAIFILGVSWYSIANAPIIDFRAYKIGTNLPQSIEIPEDAPMDEFEVLLIYEKDGVRKEFDINGELPQKESGWVYVDEKTTLLQEGYVPPIQDFFVLTEEDDITDDIVYGQGYHLLIFSKRIAEMKHQAEIMPRLNKLYQEADQQGVATYFVTASDMEDVHLLFKKHNIQIPIANLDETALKTITRSNPGLVLIKDQVIVNKWHVNNFPSTWQEAMESKNNNQAITYLCYSLILILLLLCRRLKKSEK